MSFTLLGILNAQAAGAGGAGAYDLLETTVLTSSASSVEFTGLDAYTDYKHLQIRAVGSTISGTGSANLRLTFNGDTGNNYSEHTLNGNGSTVGSTGLTSRPEIDLAGAFAAGGSSLCGAAIIDILDFSNTSKNTTVRSLHGNTNSTNQFIYLQSGAYLNTSAVTSLALAFPTDFNIGSRFSLYGIRGE